MISLAFKLDNEVATIVLLMEGCKCSFKDLSGCELHEICKCRSDGVLKLSEQDRLNFKLCLWECLRKQQTAELHFKAYVPLSREG